MKKERRLESELISALRKLTDPLKFTLSIYNGLVYNL
jgi:hypothetical protein